MVNAKRFDPLTLMEASYRVDESETGWLRGVVDTVRPVLDRGLGYFGMLYDVRDLAIVKFGTVIEVGDLPPRAERDGVMQALQAMPGVLQHSLGTTFCDTTSNYGGPLYDMVRSYHEYSGIADTLSLNAVDPTGQGCLLVTYLPRPARPPRWLAAAWTRLAAHVAAGHRLRRRLAEATRRPPEAVLTPDGNVVDAIDAAKERTNREALGRATRAVERARAMRHADPAEAIAVWRGLVAARWTLVDVVESDGRRFLVAQRNEADPGGLGILGVRERQALGFLALGHTNKVIAYEMGVSPSTVGVLLHRAARKLGV